jgi:hypothetical protein
MAGLAEQVSLWWSIKMYAIIENNLVVNSVVADEAYAAEQKWVLLPEGAGIGWTYANGQFVDSRPAPEPVPVVQPTKEELLAQINALMQQVQALP